MGITKEQQAEIDAMTEKYMGRLKERAAEGKPLKTIRAGRSPSGVSEENMEEYVALRDQLNNLKKLRRDSAVKLGELKEQMEALRSSKKAKKKVAKK